MFSRPRVRWLPLLSLFFVAAMQQPVRANPEPPANYDARVAGMGGIAITTVDNAAAVYHNPAQLELVPRFSATVVVTSLLVNLRAPFAGTGSEQDSGLIYAPLFFVGAAGHLVPGVALGFGAYVYTGFGGGFDDVRCISYRAAENGTHPDCDNPSYGGRLDPPRRQSVNLFVTELALAAQVSLTPRLSVGASLRIPWARQQVDATQEAFGVFTNALQTVSGVGNPGVLAGITYRPTDELTLGFAYRSKVAINMRGSTETELLGSVVRLDTRTTWYVPHLFRVGISYRFLERRLLVSGEFKAQLHRDANRRQVFVNTGDLSNTTVADFKWKNAYVGTLGAEYMLTESVPIRMGLTFGRAATNGETLTSFSPPPGIQYGLYGGIGYRAKPMVLDFAFAWGGGPAYTRTEPSAYCRPELQRPRDEPGQIIAGGGCTGSYDVDSWFISLSATINLDDEEE